MIDRFWGKLSEYILMYLRAKTIVVSSAVILNPTFITKLNIRSTQRGCIFGLTRFTLFRGGDGVVCVQLNVFLRFFADEHTDKELLSASAATTANIADERRSVDPADDTIFTICFCFLIDVAAGGVLNMSISSTGLSLSKCGGDQIVSKVNSSKSMKESEREVYAVGCTKFKYFLKPPG